MKMLLIILDEEDKNEHGDPRIEFMALSLSALENLHDWERIKVPKKSKVAGRAQQMLIDLGLID